MGILLWNAVYGSPRLRRTVTGTMVFYTDEGSAIGNLCNHICYVSCLLTEYVCVKDDEPGRCELLYLSPACNCCHYCCVLSCRRKAYPAAPGFKYPDFFRGI